MRSVMACDGFGLADDFVNPPDSVYWDGETEPATV